MALSELRAVVVIPARDEEAEIAGCLESLAVQTLPRAWFETVLVLDRCQDATADVALAVARRLGLVLHATSTSAAGAGAARGHGMWVAADRLQAAGRPDGLIASTDADSRPEPSWLESQLALVAAGARAIGGLLELAPDTVRDMLPEARARRAEDAAKRLARIRGEDPDAEHHHFGGASLAVTAEAYRLVGGLEPHHALEDEAFAAKLRAGGIPIVRSRAVRVETSARRVGRASRGLAVDLDVATWSASRRYAASSFPMERLRRAKGGRTVAVLIPAKEVAETIGGVLGRTVQPLAEAGLVDEVVVIDAGSADETAEVAQRAGARVIQEDEILAEHGPALGKGDAMWRGLHATGSEVVCFLDADTANPDPAHLRGLLGPILTDDSIQLVKGAFDRPLLTPAGSLEHEGGRVTELMARPLINLHEPRLAGFSQPLAGEFAGRRSLLESLSFPVGYGVEIAVLIDALRLHGLDALAESRLGVRQNRHQSLRALGEMAYAVLAAVEARLPAPRSSAGGHYMKPWADSEIAYVPIGERPPLRALDRSISAA